jgi:hypothetical protein
MEAIVARDVKSYLATREAAASTGAATDPRTAPEGVR